jgi:nicotinamidase-related amidase
MKKALILVDLQKEWALEDSDYFLGDISKLIEKTNKVLEKCRNEGYKIIFTKHIEKYSEKEFAKDSEGVEIIKEIEIKDSDIILKKNKISSFYKTDLDKQLEGIEEIIVCGILTNLCVRSLIQDAYDRDFKIKVIKDCCQALDEEIHKFTIQDLKATREEIEFLELDEFI